MREGVFRAERTLGREIASAGADAVSKDSIKRAKNRNRATSYQPMECGPRCREAMNKISFGL
jgi:hypothetical protein